MSYPFRRLAVGTIAGLALSVLASSPAFASARPDTSGWSAAPVESTHFVVHPSPGVSADDAQKVSDNFESAYATEVGSWGFDAPLSDGSLGGDGRVDVYVTNTADDGDTGEALRDNDASATTSGYAVIDPGAARSVSTAAHELFHLLQYAVYSRGPKFIKEGTAEWAAANVSGTTSWLVTYWNNPSQPLECAPGSACGSQNLSYSRWVFFDYLSERYGVGIVQEILRQEATLQADSADKGLDAIDAALAQHGSSLTQAFGDFAGANAGGTYGFSGLSGSTRYLLPAAARYTGATNIAQALQVSVDHLSAGYVRIYSGDPNSTVPNCGAATLHLTVSVPAGVTSQPSFADSSGVHKLALAGNTATADLPWTNCSGNQGVLALPNESRTQDGASFGLRLSITVTPPRPAVGTKAPSIRLRAIGRKGRYIALRVNSTGAGRLQVLFKWHYLRGSYRLHSGLNRLKLRLPSSFPGGRHQIVLTAYSTTGARGKTIKRHLAA
jgi:hypothetical protein